jgi:hypothetical protein
MCLRSVFLGDWLDTQTHIFSMCIIGVSEDLQPTPEISQECGWSFFTDVDYR